jgi:hypothetical protein
LIEVLDAEASFELHFVYSLYPHLVVLLSRTPLRFLGGLFKHLGPEAVIRIQILPPTCVASSKHWHALQS